MPFTVTSLAASAAPSWVAGMTLNQWYAISGPSPSSGFSATNNIDDVVPDECRVGPISGSDGPDAICKSYGGAALAKNFGSAGSLIVWNGGHDNYFGNEVYSFDYNTRTWTCLTVPYPSTTFPIADGWWPAHDTQVNGSPSVPHTYRLVNYHPTRNSFYTFRAMQSPGSPLVNPETCGEFPLGTKVWVRRGEAPETLGSGGWSCYDPVRDVFWLRGGLGSSISTRTMAYDPTTDEFDVYVQTGSGVSDSDQAPAYNLRDDFIAIIRPGDGVFVHNPASPTTTPPQLSTSGLGSFSAMAGFEWSSVLECFIYKPPNGNAIYKLERTSTSPSPWGTWAFTLVSTTGVTIEDMESTSGVNGKFQILEYGSNVIATVVKRTGQTGTGAVYAVRLQ